MTIAEVVVLLLIVAVFTWLISKRGNFPRGPDIECKRQPMQRVTEGIDPRVEKSASKNFDEPS